MTLSEDLSTTEHLEQLRHDLILKFGKVSEDLHIGGQMVAESWIVDRVFFPIGTPVVASGKLGVVEDHGAVLLKVHDDWYAGRTLKKVVTIQVKVGSVKKEGFYTTKGFVKTDKVTEAFAAMIADAEVTLWEDKGAWKF